MNIDKITEPLDALYEKYRYAKKNVSVSDHTKSAQDICTKWQEEIKDENISIEVPICEGAKERIDVIDLVNKTAYELKVSGKNVEHEFYKNIFKVLSYNINNPDKAVEKFVFISEEKGIKILEKATLYKQTVELSELNIEVLGIPNKLV